MIGIRDVARRAGVSPSTVSRVLSGNAFVEPEKRKRVLKAVQELNYKPNIAARSLKTGRSNLIGIIIPDIMNPYYPQVIHCMERCAEKEGLSIILCDAQGDPEREKIHFETLKHLFVDGILYIASTENTDVVNEYIGQIPIVIVNRTFDVAAPCINIDNVDASFQMTSYLIRKGHREIAVYVNDTNRQYNTGRMEGYRKALQENGIQIDNKLVITGIRNTDDACERTIRLMSSDDRPSAVFVFNDYMAQGVYLGLSKMNLRIPDDVSVVGFDDIPSDKYLIPPLTSVRHSLYDSAELIFDRLMYQIRAQKCDLSGSKISCKGNIMIRDSVKDINDCKRKGK